MKKVLIVGANFDNKGAQSMLFALTDQLMRKSPGVEVYFATNRLYPESRYIFKRVHYSTISKRIALKKIDTESLECGIKEIGRAVLGRGNTTKNWLDLNKLISQIDLIIDINGFRIGEKWSIGAHEDYLDNIRLAKLHNIPIIIMPQSFGPFNYEPKRQFLIEEMQQLLPYADVIYAREKEGYDLLCKKLKLKNVRSSYDLVLQCDELRTENVFVSQPQINLPVIDKTNAIAVIPNNRCFSNGNDPKVYNYYRIMIDELLSAGKQVYVFRHSNEDLHRCRVIYDMYNTSDSVHLLENDFSCVEYGEFIKSFQFVICSRYHGIVHAYRNGIPAIVPGWAVKYKELTELTSQNQYMFDIAEGNVDDNVVKEIVDKMLSNYDKESEVIRNKVKEVQKDSCFEILNKYVS